MEHFQISRMISLVPPSDPLLVGPDVAAILTSEVTGDFYWRRQQRCPAACLVEGGVGMSDTMYVNSCSFVERRKSLGGIGVARRDLRIEPGELPGEVA